MERGRSQESHRRPERDDDGLQYEEVQIGTGLGAGGLNGGDAPVLPTDVDGHHPDTDWLASSDHNTQVPNWTREVEPDVSDDAGAAGPLRGSHIVSVFGDEIGEIEAVYGYEPTNDPAWAVIVEGEKRTMVPLMSGQSDGDGIRVPYPKELIESAPELPDRELSVADEMAFYQHYNERRILPAGDGQGQDEQRTLRLLERAA